MKELELKSTESHSQLETILREHIFTMSCYYSDIKKDYVTPESLDIIRESLDYEVESLAQAIRYLEDSSLLTKRQALQLLLRLVEVKSDFIKSTKQEDESNEIQNETPSF